MSEAFFIVASRSTLFDDFKVYYMVLIFLNVKKSLF